MSTSVCGLWIVIGLPADAALSSALMRVVLANILTLCVWNVRNRDQLYDDGNEERYYEEEE
jgi:hypothetical protein